ncbi:MAG: sigma-70 family RNA polymerase sigma factor [Akkermansiaceae bacterium]|nr:sigma-70 family RNA polymerase sigma factor [Armatimonadota bacterium]
MNEDFRLAQRATTGDGDAMGRLIERHRASLFRIAFRELSRYEDAQDAVAESVVRACRFIHRLKNPEQFAPWIRAIVRNEARRILTRRFRQESGEATTLRLQSDTAATTHLRTNVRQAISALPNNQAYALQAYYLEGATVKEISRTLARPEGTVKWMLSRGRARLAESLKEYKPMTSNMTRRAVLIAPGYESSYQRELADALSLAGWSTVRTVTEPTEFVRFLTSNKQAATADPALIAAGDFVVLSERIGNISAWELMPFLHSLRKRSEFAVLLIAEAGRTTEEMDVAAMSGYLSGMDLFLVRPFTTDEFTSCVKRVLPKQ